jgi:hypothetical protein
MKKDTSLRNTVVSWSGQCQDPDATNLQPHSQLAATTEVCSVALVTRERVCSFILCTSQLETSDLYFTIPLAYIVLSKEFK